MMDRVVHVNRDYLVGLDCSTIKDLQSIGLNGKQECTRDQSVNDIENSTCRIIGYIYILILFANTINKDGCHFYPSFYLLNSSCLPSTLTLNLVNLPWICVLSPKLRPRVFQLNSDRPSNCRVQFSR